MREEFVRLQSVIDALLGLEKRPLRVLEAGCGSASRVNVGPDAHVVGIDISEKQLERNAAVHEKILGDIQTYELPEESFDLIISWNVLEHLSRPGPALANFQKALKRGGLLVLALPNVMSVKGLVTKYTPQWFHVWTHRHIFGRKHAGTEDYGPFPTFLRFSIAPAAIRRFAAENGLAVEYFSMYESFFQVKLKGRFPILNLPWKVFNATVRGLSLGKLDAERTEFIIVLRKATTSLPPSRDGSAVAGAAVGSKESL